MPIFSLLRHPVANSPKRSVYRFGNTPGMFFWGRLQGHGGYVAMSEKSEAANRGDDDPFPCKEICNVLALEDGKPNHWGADRGLQ
jgi:hypothetical protein